MVVGVVVTSEGQQLTLQCFALWGEKDKESPALLWISCSGDEIESGFALAVFIAQGVNCARDSAAREVQRIFDGAQGAGLVLADDEEDLGEVGIEVSGFQDRKQAQSPL